MKLFGGPQVSARPCTEHEQLKGYSNRTCRFPSIRLSVHGRSRAYGWASDMSETLERIPEAAHAFALLVLPVCGPSVRFRNTLVRVMHGSSVTEKPQAFRPFGPLPSLSRGAEIKAAAQHRPRRFSVLSSQPAPHALPYPIIKVVELPIRPDGVSVVVPPSQDCKFACNNDPLRGDFRVQ